MNLHAIVNGYIAAINPNYVGTWQISTGSTIGPDGTSSPSWVSVPNVPMQVQALTAMELQHVDALNITGEVRGVWMNGSPDNVNRPAAKGGDLLTFGGATWLVNHVIEDFDASGWSHVAVVRQVS